jgi:hypothetical protein
MKRIGLIGAFLLLVASAAHAAPVTFAYAGTVDSAFLDPATFPNPAATTFSGQFSFDSTATDGIPGGTLGNYVGSGITLARGGLNMGFASVSIGVANNLGGVDQYLPGFFDAVTSLSIRLEDLQGTVLASDALPLTPPSLAAFEVRMLVFQLSDIDGNLLADVNGTITSLTCTAGCGTPPPAPEPASLTLLAGGIGALFARRRLRRR